MQFYKDYCHRNLQVLVRPMPSKWESERPEEESGSQENDRGPQTVIWTSSSEETLTEKACIRHRNINDGHHCRQILLTQQPGNPDGWKELTPFASRLAWATSDHRRATTTLTFTSVGYVARRLVAVDLSGPILSLQQAPWTIRPRNTPKSMVWSR